MRLLGKSMAQYPSPCRRALAERPLGVLGSQAYWALEKPGSAHVAAGNSLPYSSALPPAPTGKLQRKSSSPPLEVVTRATHVLLGLHRGQQRRAACTHQTHSRERFPNLVDMAASQ